MPTGGHPTQQGHGAPPWWRTIPPPVTPERLSQIVAFLRSLGLEPSAPEGPGISASVLAPIEEALSHSSLGQHLNHERLEFLGDAVLRLAATDFLRQEHGTLPVGEQSALRSQLVSDQWLTSLGERCGLGNIIRLSPMASGDAAGYATVLAECTEAFLGGIYLAWGGPSGGLEPISRWLTPHWRVSVASVLADPHRLNWKSALQEWSQGQGLGLPRYACEETSLVHADPRRFHSRVRLTKQVGLDQPWRDPLGEGWGRSRRAAEQEAARDALGWLGPLTQGKTAQR
jgi:ribonuclease-3